MLNNENYVRLRAAKAFPGMTLALCLTKMYAYRKGCEAKNRDLPDEGWLAADFNAGILRTHPIMLSLCHHFSALSWGQTLMTMTVQVLHTLLSEPLPCAKYFQNIQRPKRLSFKFLDGAILFPRLWKGCTDHESVCFLLKLDANVLDETCPGMNNRVFQTYSDLLIVQLLELCTSSEQFVELNTIFC